MAWRSFVICIGMLLLAITRCHCVALSKVPSPNPSVIWKFNLRGNSTQTKPKEAHSPRGRLIIGRHPREDATLGEYLVDADYQSDMGWDEAEAYFRAQGNWAANPGSVEVQKLMQTEPNVECTGDSMKLNVKGSFSTPGALFVVYRGSSLAYLPLSELPSSCGYTLKTTQRDLVLVAPYDGCFVSLEEDGYVLSLHWWGIPVRMSCPVRRQSLYNPPRVTCNTAGMVVNTDWASPVHKIQVNLNGLWKPLMEILPKCGFGFEFASNAGGAAISIRYAPCLGVKDGMFTLGLAGDDAVTVSCPSVHIFDDPSKGILLTVAPLKYPNITLTGTQVGQEQNPFHQPPKAQITVTVPPKNPASPDNKQPQAYHFWPPHPSASQTPDPFPPHQSPFYPPSLPVGPSQKPASPTSKADGQEPVTPPKPPKTHDGKTPVGPEGQNAWPYPFPYYFRPPQPSQGPDLPTPGVPQKPASPTSKTEGQKPVTHPKPPKTQINKQPVAPDGQNPEPYQVPYFTWPSHSSASQTPDPFPPHQTPFYPPSLPVGPSQKPASPTSKAEGQEPVTTPKPPKTHDGKTPVGPEGQNAWPYPFPYYFWPPQPSQGPDLPTPDVPQKPASPTSKTEGQEPMTHPKPHKTHDGETPVVPEGHNPWPYQVPYFIRPPPSASQTPDPFPPHQTPFHPSLPVGPSQKPASPTSKNEGQEPVTHPKPPKTWVTTNLQPSDPLATVTQTKPSESEKGPPFNSLVHCPEKCLSGLSQCCVSFSYHHHDHFIYPLKVDRRIAPFSTLGQSVPEVIQGTLDSGLPNTIEASHDTIVNPPFQNLETNLHNFLSQVKYASKGNQEFEYSPPEGILDQDLPISFESSQSELGHPTYIQQHERTSNELQSPDEKQSPSQTLTQGLFTILEPAMGHYNMFKDAMASSVDSTDYYFEDVHPLSNSRKFVKPTSEHPLSNGHLLLEHGPPGREPSSQRLAARGLGLSHTNSASKPLRHYPQSKETSHPPEPGNQMDAMYRSKDQSNHILGQTFNRHSSVDDYTNGDNQPFPRRMH